MRFRLLLLIAFGAARMGCAADTTVVLGLGDEIGSLIVVHAPFSSAPRPVAHEVDPGAPIEFELTTDPEGAVLVLGYAASLEELGLVAGELQVHPRGGRPPPPDRVFRLSGSSSDRAIFQELGQIPPELDLRLEAMGVCSSFLEHGRRRFPVPESLVQIFATPIDDERALVGVSGGRLFISSRDEDVPFDLQVGDLAAAVRDGTGELWIAQIDGRVVTGHPDRSFEPAPSIPVSMGGVAHLAASPPGQDFELYVATSFAEVFRLDGNAWTQIRAPSGENVDRTRVRLLWLRPGRVALLGTGLSRVIELEAGQSDVFALTLPDHQSEDALFETAWVRDLGAVIGSRYSVFHVRADNRWDRLPLAEDSPARTPIAEMIVDLGDGTFLSGGENGHLYQWVVPRGQCPELQSSLIGIAVEHAVPFGTGFMAFADIDGGPFDITVFDRE